MARSEKGTMHADDRADRSSVPSFPPYFLIAAAFLVACTIYFGVSCLNFFVDDAFIGLRYARNIARGLGPVYNAGTYVEGFSNPLWVLLLTIGHIVPIIDSPRSALAFAKACSMVFGLCGLMLVICSGHRFTLRASKWTRWVGIVAGVVLVVNCCWQLWNIGGLETPLHSLLVLLACLRLAEALKNASVRNALLLSFVLGLLAWSRPEGPMYFLTAVGILILKNPRAGLRFFSTLVLPFCLLSGILIVLRLYFYGVLLPNTVVAKVYNIPWGIKIRVGYHYVYLYLIEQSNLGWLLVLSLLRLPRAIRQNTYHLSAWSFICVQVLFTLLVGGDWMPAGRFLHPVYPLISLIIASTAVDILSDFEAKEIRARPLELSLGALVVLLFVFTLFQHALLGMKGDRPSGWKNPYLIEERYVRVANWLANSLPPDSTLALGEGGYIAYATDLRVFDCFGLMEPEIARTSTRGGVNTKFSEDIFFSRSPQYVLFAHVEQSYGKETYRYEYQERLARDERFWRSYESVELPDALIQGGWRLYEKRELN